MDDESEDEPSLIQVVPGDATIGLTCESCGLPAAWSNNLYVLFGEAAPLLAKTVSGCICCDAPVKEA